PEDRADGNACLLCPRNIKVDFVLRIVCAERTLCILYLRALHKLANELLGYLVEFGEASSKSVQYLHLKSRRNAEARHAGWCKKQYIRVGNACGNLKHPGHDGIRGH